MDISLRVGTRIRTTVCQSSTQNDIIREHLPWSKDGLQKDKKLNIQAKAENWREREILRKRQRQTKPVIVPFLRKAVHRLDSMSFSKFLITNPQKLFSQQNDSWLRHKLGVAWQATVLQRIYVLGCGVQKGRGKCHVTVQPAVHEERRKSSYFNFCVRLSPEKSQGFPESKVLGLGDEKQRYLKLSITLCCL